MSSDDKPESRTQFEVFVQQQQDSEHPVDRIDRIVTSRLNLSELDRRIDTKSDELKNVLADSIGLWIQLEAMLNERSSERCEEYFNLGYEYGIAAGCAQALEELNPRKFEPDSSKLAERLRVQVQCADIPVRSAAWVLLETAWALVAGNSQNNTILEGEPR